MGKIKVCFIFIISDEIIVVFVYLFRFYRRVDCFDCRIVYVRNIGRRKEGSFGCSVCQWESWEVSDVFILSVFVYIVYFVS